MSTDAIKNVQTGSVHDVSTSFEAQHPHLKNKATDNVPSSVDTFKISKSDQKSKTDKLLARPAMKIPAAINENSYTKQIQKVLDFIPQEMKKDITNNYGDTLKNIRNFVETKFKASFYCTPFLQASAHILSNHYTTKTKDIHDSLLSLKQQPLPLQNKVVDKIVRETAIRIHNNPDAQEQFKDAKLEMPFFKAATLFLLTYYPQEMSHSISEAYETAIPLEVILGSKDLDFSKLHNISSPAKIRKRAIKMLLKAQKERAKMSMGIDYINPEMSFSDAIKTATHTMDKYIKNQMMEQYFNANLENLSHKQVLTILDTMSFIFRYNDLSNHIWEPYFDHNGVNPQNRMILHYLSVYIDELSFEQIEKLQKRAHNETKNTIMKMYYSLHSA